MQTLARTLNIDSGKLLAITGDRRLLIAECSAQVKVYEHSQNVKVPGAHDYVVKTHHSVIVRCTAPETTRPVDVDFLRGVSRFEFSGKCQRLDGVFEHLAFDNLHPEDIDLCGGNWNFTVIGSYELVSRLLVF